MIFEPILSFSRSDSNYVLFSNRPVHAACTEACLPQLESSIQSIERVDLQLISAFRRALRSFHSSSQVRSLADPETFSRLKPLHPEEILLAYQHGVLTAS